MDGWTGGRQTRRRGQVHVAHEPPLPSRSLSVTAGSIIRPRRTACSALLYLHDVFLFRSARGWRATQSWYLDRGTELEERHAIRRRQSLQVPTKECMYFVPCFLRPRHLSGLQPRLGFPGACKPQSRICCSWCRKHLDKGHPAGSAASHGPRFTVSRPRRKQPLWRSVPLVTGGRTVIHLSFLACIFAPRLASPNACLVQRVPAISTLAGLVSWLLDQALQASRSRALGEFRHVNLVLGCLSSD